jgi:disulfide bond formation protein DsbB
MTAASRRRLLLVCAFLSFAAVGAALVSQHVFGMLPCAWCVLQRLLYLVLGVVCLAGAGGLRLARGAAGIGAIIAVIGVTTAWHQYTVAAHMVSCEQTWADRFMVQSGLDGALVWLFGVMSTCMQASVELAGVQYVLWSLTLFVVLAAVLLRAALRPAA